MPRSEASRICNPSRICNLSRICKLIAIAATLFGIGLPAAAQTPEKIGIVVMHGKGGSPDRHVDSLAAGLERKGYLVANLQMPWSGKRDYDKDVTAAEQEVSAALDTLRSNGAKKVFVAGHSQGGTFAVHYASKYPIDGVIPIAPGGNVGSANFREQLGATVELARKQIADGKGNELGRFMDYEGSRGTSPVIATATTYLTWFDPDGAMNLLKSARALPPGLPVLLIVPRHDYPGLLRAKQANYGALPGNPLTRLYEPNSDHLGAPRASIDEIVRWTAEVAAR